MTIGSYHDHHSGAQHVGRALRVLHPTPSIDHSSGPPEPSNTAAAFRPSAVASEPARRRTSASPAS